MHLSCKQKKFFLQNLIEVIENLKCLSSTLRFLTLAGNRISTVQGLKDLRVLGFLDLSDNFINEFDIDELPKSVSFILFKNNACAGKPDYRYGSSIICSCCCYGVFIYSSVVIIFLRKKFLNLFVIKSKEEYN